MDLSFHGAAGTVTGSCFMLTTERARILIDCGMFQGSKTLKQLNYDAFPFEASNIDAVLLTHAHIDHSGLLPKLMLAGYRGRIVTTAATVALLGCMLPDSGHIQESEVEQFNRRARHRARRPVTPIYTEADAVRCLKLLDGVAYRVWRPVAEGVRARWWNAGHLLGSASIEVEISEPRSKPLRLLFSGDIGPDRKLLQDPAEGPDALDVVVMESTYGDTDRKDLSAKERRALLAAEVLAARDRGGAMLIPSFAVERTQEVVTDLVALMREKRVPEAQIFVDSPLARMATAVFQRFAAVLADGAELQAAFGSRLIRVTATGEESRALADLGGFHIIVAASGMCEAGRIRHHLRNWLPRAQGTVLLVGYQSVGTLGRILQDGASAVRIQGDEFAVKATIRSLDCYSGHADGPELVRWLAARGRPTSSLFLVHGEPDGLAGLRQRVAEAGLMPVEQIITPQIDERYHVTIGGARLLTSDARRRIAPESVANLDWHNDLSKLYLDIDARMHTAADEKARQVIIRRMRRALEQEVE